MRRVEPVWVWFPVISKEAHVGMPFALILVELKGRSVRGSRAVGHLNLIPVAEKLGVRQRLEGLVVTEVDVLNRRYGAPVLVSELRDGAVGLCVRAVEAEDHVHVGAED